MPDKESLPDLERLKEENERLRASIDELKVLNEIATAIGALSSLDDVMSLIVRKCIKHLGVEQAAVILVEPADGGMPFKTMIRKADRSTYTLPYRLDDHLRGYMLKNQTPLLVNDLAGDPRFNLALEKDSPIRSVLGVPMFRKGKIIGILNAFNKKAPGGFTNADQRLLYIIASQSAQVIENARLAEEEKVLALMQEEMRLAYRIQMDLLPKAPPVIPGYDIAGMSIPAKEVGGDYYDFIQIGDDRLAICLGDVSGKGVPAALLMANLQATIRSQIGEHPAPGECMRQSNYLLYQSTDAGSFVTFFLGVLDTKTNTIACANAGHNPPVLIKQPGPAERLSVGGLILACLEDFQYPEVSVQLEPGNVLFIYSDGLTEAINASEEEFGEERLAATIKANRDATASDLVDKTIAAVREHAGAIPQADDMTAVAIKRL